MLHPGMHTRSARAHALVLLVALLAACSKAPESESPEAIAMPSQELAPGPGVVQAAAPSTEPRPGPQGEALAAAPKPRAVEAPAPRSVAEPETPQGFQLDHVLDEQQVVQSSASVVTLLPEADSNNVSRGTNIDVTFSEAMQPESISARTFRVRSDVTVIAGAVHYDASLRRATFDPTAPLPANSLITIELAETASAAGSTLAPVEWSFTTGSQ